MRLIDVTDQQRREVQAAELIILSELDRICCKYNIRYMVAYGTLIGAIRHNGFIPWDDDVDVCMPREDFEKFKQICKERLGEDLFYQDHETDPEYYYLIDKIRLNGTVFKESFVAKYKIHHGIYIDVFPIDVIPDSRIKRFLQYYRFHFFRTGLMAKYLDLEARSGRKKILMSLLKVLYAPFSLEYLYNNANLVASKYQKTDSRKMGCFFSPYRKKDIFEKDLFEAYERHSFETIEVSIPQKYDIYLSSIYGAYMQLPAPTERITRHTIIELKLPELAGRKGE